MFSLLQLTVVGCAIAGADARWFKGSDGSESSWAPARETFGATRVDEMGWSPRPTVEAAEVNVFDHELRKRAGTSTCGYFSSSAPAVVCINSASCVVNTRDSVLGCCNSADVGLCRIPTRCYERTQSALYTSASGQVYTTWCSQSDYPSCVTYSYRAAGSPYGGYKAFGCGERAALYTIDYFDPALTASRSTTASSSRATSTTRASTSSSRSSTSSSSSSDSSLSGASTTTSSATSSSTSATSSPEAQSAGTPVGPIVGGVVGGVGGLALIGFGIFFLVRYSKKNKDNGPQQPPIQPQPTGATGSFSPGAPGSQYMGPTPPPMSQTPQQYGAYPPGAFAAAGSVDNRHSLAPSSAYGPYPGKSPYDPMSPGTAGSPSYVESHYTGQSGYTPPPGAPGPSGPQQYAAYNNSPSPPVQPQNQPQQYQAYNPTYGQNPPQPQYPQHQQQGPVMELPTSRPDRELRELE